MLKDYYEILSVPQDASLTEIKQQYQKLLLIVMTRFLSARLSYSFVFSLYSDVFPPRLFVLYINSIIPTNNNKINRSSQDLPRQFF